MIYRGESTGVCRSLVGNTRDRDHLGCLSIDWRKILKLIFKE